MKSNKILIGIFVFFLIALALNVNAQQLSYKQNQEVDLKVFCYDSNNDLCTSSYNCNLTVQYPNSTILLNNIALQFNTQYYNYTLSSTQTSTIGAYGGFVVCKNYVANTSLATDFNFYITKSGSYLENSEAVGYLGYILIFIIVLGIVSFFMLSLQKQENTPFLPPIARVVISILAFILMISGLAFINQQIEQISFLSVDLSTTAVTIIQAIYIALIILVMALSLYYLYGFLIELVASMAEKRNRQ